MKNFLTRILGGPGEMSSGGKLIFHATEVCAECGTKLVRRENPGESSGASSEEESWNCPNLDCPARVREHIKHWCAPDAMNLAGADDELIAQLVKSGLVRDLAELYAVRPAEIASLPGRDEAFGKKFVETLADSKSREAWRVLYGLKISEVDAQTAQKLCEHFHAVDDILAAGPERLRKLSDIDEKIACSIARWYSDQVNRRLMRRLQKTNINFLCKPPT